MKPSSRWLSSNIFHYFLCIVTAGSGLWASVCRRQKESWLSYVYRSSTGSRKVFRGRGSGSKVAWLSMASLWAKAPGETTTPTAWVGPQTTDRE